MKNLFKDYDEYYKSFEGFEQLYGKKLTDKQFVEDEIKVHEKVMEIQNAYCKCKTLSSLKRLAKKRGDEIEENKKSINLIIKDLGQYFYYLNDKNFKKIIQENTDYWRIHLIHLYYVLDKLNGGTK